MQKFSLRDIWSKSAPWYVKLGRRLAIDAVAVAAAMIYLPDALPARHLNAMEKTSLRRVFNDTLDLDRIKVFSGPGARLYLNVVDAHAAALHNSVFVRDDNGAEFLDLTARDAYTIIHELTHIRQYQHGRTPFYAEMWQGMERRMPFFDPFRLYRYDLEKNKKLDEYLIEQQASIMADYFQLSRGGRPTILMQNRLAATERNRRYADVLKDIVNPSLKLPPPQPERDGAVMVAANLKP